jgi:hypothetical protein
MTEVIRLNHAHHLGEPATLPLSDGFNCCFMVELAPESKKGRYTAFFTC